MSYSISFFQGFHRLKIIGMYKYILESAGNINWMAIFALLTFFTVFVVSAYTVLIQGKEFTDKMSKMPLEETEHPVT